MKDNNQSTEFQNQVPSKKPNLFYDWWEEIYPKDFYSLLKKITLSFNKIKDGYVLSHNCIKKPTA